MAWIKRHKRKKKPISKILVDFKLMFSSYMHDFVCFIAPIDFILGKCGSWKRANKYATNSNFKKFENALNLTSVSIHLMPGLWYTSKKGTGIYLAPWHIIFELPLALYGQPGNKSRTSALHLHPLFIHACIHMTHAAPTWSHSYKYHQILTYQARINY